mmetsp:Transcript_13905/g.29348  ORF Transcript_13905/g.29348 Transcript_13905/m.29348 type:complete len:393 (-) Transcript_13905:39-1217(-)|eukprot:CAMPEP_0171339340 /NCGR_PEP_ID=MMETSP0878-20121228/7895_1 /TAXON_ID=67004 /ORGANISM="Thalassiosira weissflogii, Strain CCMP1336" /LENGTH=392 /DNA_ID=CAMNT_0011841247 /DNA_START=84 /DNA_END=1262 /DNA_ORIENTATION=-
MASETATSYRLGVLGAAKIAKKNCRAASHPSTSCSVVAVASRSKEKGSDFVNEIFTSTGKTAPAVVSGENAYLDLLADSTGSLNLDAVYIPLPTKLHEKYVLEALSSGHHVLLEKPVAVSADSYRRMLNAASANGKFLQDGTMFVHHPRTKEFVNAIPNPNRLSFNFTFNGDDDFFKNDVRIKKDGDFMGCIGDLGWYCVRMGLLVFTRMDAKALKGIVTDVQVFRFQLSEDGVPIDADCMVYFTDNRVLSFHCSFLHPLNQTAHMTGSGQIYNVTITDPILPYEGEKITFAFAKQDLIQFDEICTKEKKVVECDNSLVQEVCMWGHFAKWSKKIQEERDSPKDPENEVWWGGDSNEVKAANAMATFSLHTQIVLDGLMDSIRLKGAKISLL